MCVCVCVCFRLQQAGQQVYRSALQCFNVPSVASAAVCFCELLGVCSLKLRVDIRAMNIILQHWSQHNTHTAPTQQLHTLGTHTTHTPPRHSSYTHWVHTHTHRPDTAATHTGYTQHTHHPDTASTHTGYTQHTHTAGLTR